MKTQFCNPEAEESAKAAALNALGENFGKTFSPQLMDMWLELLTVYPAAMVHSAVRLVIERYEFKTLPPFAILKSALNDLAGTSDKDLELQAISEWGILLETIGRFGHNHKPPLHPTTDYALRLMGGWHDACRNWNTRELDFKRRDFISLWVESHGRVDQLRLGVDGVKLGLAGDRNHRGAGLLPVGAHLKLISGGEVQ